MTLFFRPPLVGNSLGVGTPTTPDSVAAFKPSFTKQLPNLATSGAIVAGRREITSVSHGLELGSPVRIPSGPGGAFEDREVANIITPDLFRILTDITNSITDKQILNSPDIAQFLKAIAGPAFGITAISNGGSFEVGRQAAADFGKFQLRGTSTWSIFARKANAPVTFDFDVEPMNGINQGQFRFFRTSITSGLKRVVFFDGVDILTEIEHIVLGVAGAGTFFHPDAGNVGIGTTATPTSHQLEVVGDTKLDGSFVTKRLASGAGNLISTGAVILAVTDTAAPRTVTIQSADILNSGQIFIVQDETGGAAANNITVATEGSETIDGAASDSITTNRGNIFMYSNGTNLIIISRK